MSQRSAADACACGHPFGMHDAVGCSAYIGGYPESTHIRRYCSCAGYTANDITSSETPDDESAA
jgi:hypothetical protein